MMEWMDGWMDWRTVDGWIDRYPSYFSPLGSLLNNERFNRGILPQMNGLHYLPTLRLFPSTVVIKSPSDPYVP